jgi:hypothetical protein
VLLAELEVFHSRAIAPTRRVALGRRNLPVDPAPGFGGILLGGIVAAHIPDLDPDLFDDLHRLTLQLQEGLRIPQPRLRHRLQTDRVGLLRTPHRLVGEGEDLTFDLGDRGAPAQHILAAVYAAGDVAVAVRPRVMEAVRAAMRWTGAIDRSLVAHLTGFDRSGGWSSEAFHDPVRWALGVLGFSRAGPRRVPARGTVQRRFRELVRDAHPDHGGDTGEAASRIAELTEARRILLTA